MSVDCKANVDFMPKFINVSMGFIYSLSAAGCLGWFQKDGLSSDINVQLKRNAGTHDWTVKVLLITAQLKLLMVCKRLGYRG